MQCVILAGGLGTRMYPEAKVTPKCLLPVAGKPFADWQLSWLASEGVTDVVYSVGYLGQLVQEFVGGGEPWGLRVRYVIEGSELLGTGGALRLALDVGVLEEEFFVLYGDSFLSVALREVVSAHSRVAEPVLMTVYRNEGRWETGNARFDGKKVKRYEKGYAGPEPMPFVDYGLSHFRRWVIAERMRSHVKSDLAELFNQLSESSELAGYEARERFYEIGSPEGLAQLEAHLLS